MSGVFLAPILMLMNQPHLAQPLYKLYSYLCHQRVERSSFINDEYPFWRYYSVEELKSLGYLPEQNEFIPKPFAEIFYGYPYWGNEDLGYKLAVCNRDVAIYGTLTILITMLWLLYKINGYYIKISNLQLIILVILLTLPMAVDGFTQIYLEVTNTSLNDPFIRAYMDSALKRYITGSLFGVAVSLTFFYLLKDIDSYNNTENKISQDLEVKQ